MHSSKRGEESSPLKNWRCEVQVGDPGTSGLASLVAAEFCSYKTAKLCKIVIVYGALANLNSLQIND